jgi:hypothetical protein
MSTACEVQRRLPNDIREAIEESWEPIFPDAAEPGGCNFAKGCAWRPQKILLTAPGEIMPILERNLTKIEKMELLSNISKDELFEYLKKWDHDYLCLGVKYGICRQEVNAEKAVGLIENQEIKTVFLIGEKIHAILFVPWWRWRH